MNLKITIVCCIISINNAFAEFDDFIHTLPAKDSTVLINTIKSKIEASIAALVILKSDKLNNYKSIIEISKNANNELSNMIIIGIENKDYLNNVKKEYNICKLTELDLVSNQIYTLFLKSKSKILSLKINQLEEDCTKIQVLTN